MRDDELMDAIAGRALQRFEEFNLQNSVNTAWAFAVVAMPQEAQGGAPRVPSEHGNAHPLGAGRRGVEEGSPGRGQTPGAIPLSHLESGALLQ
jgi:hypothetical protein